MKSIDLRGLKEQRTPEQAEKLARLLVRYKHLFTDNLDLNTGTTAHNTTATIYTTEPNPRITPRPQKCGPEDKQEFLKTIKQKLQEGIIEPSFAPWCSNALLVRKDGKVRMVIDYRTLNKATVKDSYPMPRIQDVTDVLKGAHWFSSADGVQAFRQIPMADERSKDLTTFRGLTGGLYRYRYMTMGLVNAMAIWSRFIDTAMDGLHDFVLCYADDILIFTKSTSIDDHINDLERVFIQLDKYGIKVKASKLKIGLKEMPFLGVVITEDGIKPNPAKTAAIEKLAYPTSLKELRSMIGMFAYYRRFIEKFSEVASPLYEQAKKHTHNPRNAKGIILTEESKAAFDFLKKAITQEPVMLHYPNWDIPFEIHTDASSKAVAAILCQRIDGKERVIMYASKTLNKGEEKYHIYEKEGLAVVWAAEIFRKYIRNKRTVVRTDCSALQC